MARSWHMGIVFVAGVALGAAGAWTMLGAHDGDTAEAVPAAASRSAGHAQAVSAPAEPVQAAALTAVPASAVEPTFRSCAYAPVVRKAAPDDGQETLQSHPSGATPSEVAAMLLTGKEAFASGRQRDAEIDFLNACRNADVVPVTDGVSLADAMYQLARLYGNLVIAGAPNRPELRRRAEELYTASLQEYRSHYGERGEKTRFAREGLAAVEQAGSTPVAAHAAARPHATAVAAPAAHPAHAATHAAASSPPHTEPHQETHGATRSAAAQPAARPGSATVAVAPRRHAEPLPPAPAKPLVPATDAVQAPGTASGDAHDAGDTQ